MQQFESRVHFRCPACFSYSTLEIPVPEFDFDVERASDLTSEGDAEFYCQYCEGEFSAQVWCCSSHCEFRLEGHPNLIFTGDPPFYSQEQEDFWIDYDPPEDPFQICLATLDKLESLITDEPTHRDDAQLLNRMVLSQSISALEAYLFDTLLNRVLPNKNALVRLIQKDKHIRNEKFSLTNIAISENFVEEEIKKYLSGIVYHNLERVNFLYEASLVCPLKSDERNWTILLKSIDHRHDCVHRNGLNREGKRPLIFTLEYVGSVIGAVRSLVSRVESHFAGYGSL